MSYSKIDWPTNRRLVTWLWLWLRESWDGSQKSRRLVWDGRQPARTMSTAGQWRQWLRTLVFAWKWSVKCSHELCVKSVQSDYQSRLQSLKHVTVWMCTSLAAERLDGFCSYSAFMSSSVPGEYEHSRSENWFPLDWGRKLIWWFFSKAVLTIFIEFR
jgi:hypothetical protein